MTRTTKESYVERWKEIVDSSPGEFAPIWKTVTQYLHLIATESKMGEKKARIDCGEHATDPSQNADSLYCLIRQGFPASLAVIQIGQNVLGGEISFESGNDGKFFNYVPENMR